VARSSSARTRSGCLAGYFGAAPAHGDADVGGVQGGAVVDAVAGHRDDLPAGAQRVDDGDLLLRGGAGEDPGAAFGVRAAVVGAAVEDGFPGRDDAEVGGDRGGGGGVVAGDQDRGDAGLPAGRDGGRGGGPGWVEDRNEAE
jgi:hypothetical protein